MRAVLKGIQFSDVGAYLSEISSEYPLHATNFGGKITGDIVSVLEQLTGSIGVLGLSFFPWNGLDLARPIITVDRHRKWCPCCYSEAAENDIRIYDRLAWAPKGVELCLVHGVKLETKCENCGNEKFPFLRNNDVAGFCPKCQHWLGGRGREFPINNDDYARYQWWVARCVSDLLESDPPIDIDLRTNIDLCIDTLIIRHFDDNGTLAAIHLGRSKCRISEWRSGRVSPKWDVLCQISYAFQIPIRAMLEGDKDAIEFSSLERLPSAMTGDRPQSTQLKSPDWGAIKQFVLEIESGLHTDISRITQIGKRFGIDRTYLRKKFPDEIGRLDEILVRRRKATKEFREHRRLFVLDDATAEIAQNLFENGIKITRRSVANGLAQRGVSFRHTDSIRILALANEIGRRYLTKRE